VGVDVDGGVDEEDEVDAASAGRAIDVDDAVGCEVVVVG
jgi:hypothetical protein